MKERGEGSSDAEHKPTVIETNAQCLDPAAIFHLIKDVLGFLLFMHQQIPSVLQDLSLEFQTLQAEKEELEGALAQPELRASSRRQQMSKMRENRLGIKRLDKLMQSIGALENSLRLLITHVPHIEGVILVLGATPIRPHHLYHFSFSHAYNAAGRATGDFAKSKSAECLSRKAIRALIANGVGSDTYPGPTKLFLLVKAPPSFNMPLNFVPKRDFRYSKKLVPFKLRLKCRSQDLQSDGPDFSSQTGSSTGAGDNSSNDLIWFLCRHVVKGLAFKTTTDE